MDAKRSLPPAIEPIDPPRSGPKECAILDRPATPLVLEGRPEYQPAFADRVVHPGDLLLEPAVGLDAPRIGGDVRAFAVWALCIAPQPSANSRCPKVQ